MSGGAQPLAARTCCRCYLVCRPSYLAHLVVAGLDVGRFHWSGHVPSRVQMVGLAVSATSWGLVLCAMAVNRFFAATVRLQTEGSLITAGPYR